MKNTIASLIQYLHQLEFLFPALAGGLIDYIAQLRNAPGGFSLVGALTHPLSAAFFGWVLGGLWLAFGFPEEQYGVACAIGGYYGVRISELALFIAYRQFEKKP